MTWSYRPTRPGIVRQCLGKEALEEWRAGLKARGIERRTGVPMRVYHCPICHKWHVTKKPQR